MASNVLRIAVASSVVLLALLFSLPATRIEVRRQFLTTFAWDAGNRGKQFDAYSPNPAIRSAWISRRIAIANAHPHDYLVQLAVAEDRVEATPASADRFASCIELTIKFPSNPSAYAYALRREMSNVILHSRSMWGYSTGNPRLDWQSPTPPPAHLLAIMDAQASRGERLDPENAFFPVAHMIVRLAQHRDADALADLRRAAGCSAWREYTADLLAGQNKLETLTTGDNSTLRRFMAGESLLLPEFADIRHAARIAAGLATYRERHGDREGGAIISLEAIRVGSLMDKSDGFVINTLVGSESVNSRGAYMVERFWAQGALCAHAQVNRPGRRYSRSRRPMGRLRSCQFNNVV